MTAGTTRSPGRGERAVHRPLAVRRSQARRRRPSGRWSRGARPRARGPRPRRRPMRRSRGRRRSRRIRCRCRNRAGRTGRRSRSCAPRGAVGIAARDVRRWSCRVPVMSWAAPKPSVRRLTSTIPRRPPARAARVPAGDTRSTRGGSGRRRDRRSGRRRTGRRAGTRRRAPTGRGGSTGSATSRARPVRPGAAPGRTRRSTGARAAKFRKRESAREPVERCVGERQPQRVGPDERRVGARGSMPAEKSTPTGA